MNKIWLIARNTYRSRVRSGTFLFLTFALPVLMVVVGAIAYFSMSSDLEQALVGYVDQTEQLTSVDQVSVEGTTLSFVHLNSIEEANDALSNGNITGYLLIPEGYFEGEPVQYHALEAPGAELNLAFEHFMRRALLAGTSEEILTRLEEPAEYTYTSLNTGEEIRSTLGLVVRLLVPIILAIVFGIAVVFSTGQLGTALVKEKDQRAMEIVITSLRPFELVAGKVLGMSLLALTQFGVWTLGGIVALVLAFFTGEDLSQISISWEVVLWGLLLIVPGYLLFAMLGAGLGIIAGDTQQAQQLAGIFGMFGLVPIYFTSVLIDSPNGTAAMLMSIFPLTAPTVMLMRMAFTDVPIWQLLASLSLIVVSLLLTTWVVARIFRAAMLVYGQTLRPRQIWHALRQM